MNKTLANAPLVEAIFEIRWQQPELQAGMLQDANYSLLIGRLYDRLNKYYPIHQQLPTALIPAEIAGGVIQHRFRTGEEQWPLIQLGPGILTVNDLKQSYHWHNFSSQIIQSADALFTAYPQPNKLIINHLALRYINALDFDFAADDTLRFLQKNLKINITFPSFLQEMPITKLVRLDNTFSFQCSQPNAKINIRFTQGRKDDQEALIWEMVVVSTDQDIPTLPQDLEHWLNDAHSIIETWFFNLIEGELQKRFE